MALPLRLRRAVALSSKIAPSPRSPPLLRLISLFSGPTPPRPFLETLASAPFLHAMLFDRQRDGGDERKISPDEILFEGCDYNHWDFPKDPAPTREEMIETYIQTLAKVVGREISRPVSSRIEAKITAFAVESRRRDAAAMSIAAMGELEKRQRQRLREEAVQRRPGEFCYPLDSSVSEGGEEWTVAEEQQTPVKRNKRKMVGREEVEAKRRRVKCSKEPVMEEQTPEKKRKMVGKEEVEAKKRRIAGVAVKGEDGAAVTGMDVRKKETSFPSLKRKRIAERDEAEATKRISLSSSPVCSSTDSSSHDGVCSSNGSSSRSRDRACSSSRGQASGDAAVVSPQGKRTHRKVS